MINLKKLLIFIISKLYISVILIIIILTLKNTILINSDFFKQKNLFIVKTYLYHNFTLGAPNTSLIKKTFYDDERKNSYNFNISRIKMDNYKDNFYLTLSYIFKNKIHYDEITKNIENSWKIYSKKILKFQEKGYSFQKEKEGELQEIFIENKKSSFVSSFDKSSGVVKYFDPVYEIIYQEEFQKNQYLDLLNYLIILIIFLNIFGSYIFFIKKDLKNFFKYF